MFNLISKTLKGEEILEAINTLRTSRGRTADQAFLDLRDTFSPLLKSRVNSVKHIANNYQELKEIQYFVESTFSEILLAKQLDTSNLNRVKAYIKRMMNVKITEMGVKEQLGKTLIITKMQDVYNALKRYHKKYKRLPDFNDKRDLSDFAKVIKLDIKSVKEVIKGLGSSKIKSIFEEIGGRDTENVETLLDSIKSQEPLPDEVFRDKELMKVFEQMIARYLSPDQRKVFKLYYLEGGKEERTKNEIAKELGITERKFRHLLDQGKVKLKSSPAIRELLTATKQSRFVRIALKVYDFVKIDKQYEFVNREKSSELLINDIIQRKI